MKLFFLLIVKIFAFIAKSYFLFHVIIILYKKFKTENIIRKILSSSWFFIAMILLLNSIDDFTWILKLLRHLEYIDISSNFILILGRISWIAYCYEYFLLGTLIEKLIKRTFHITIKHYGEILFCIISSILLSFIIIFDYSMLNEQLHAIEFMLYAIIHYYIIASLLMSLILIIHNIYHKNLPHILEHQMSIFTTVFLIPHTLFIISSLNEFMYYIIQHVPINDYIFVGCGDIMFTTTLYFCAKKILNFRFLNIHTHMQSPKKINFINKFREIIDRINHIETFDEIRALSNEFLTNTFNLKSQHTYLHIESVSPESDIGTMNTELTQDMQEELHAVHNFLNNLTSFHKPETHKPIFITDELAFDYFYQQDKQKKIILDFLNSVNASVFIPLYEEKSIIGYIVIRQNARSTTPFFNDIEQDELLIFSRYINSLIHLLRNRNLTFLIQHRQELIDELYMKERLVHHYQECIKTILQSQQNIVAGIAIYKNRRIHWENRTVFTIFNITNEKEIPEPVTIKLKQIIYETKKHKTNRSAIIENKKGETILCTAMQSIDESQIFILLIPSVFSSQQFNIQFDQLQDHALWNYVLYLDTTKAGQLINQIIPSSNESFLQFKIELFKMSFTNKPIFLDVSQQDVESIAEIIHYISLRSIFHIFIVAKKELDYEESIALFGQDSLPWEPTPPTESCIFEKLSNTGTLFIKNIENLSKFSQNRLLAYLNTGFFQPIKSDRKIASNIRIICSANKTLETLVQQGTFSEPLFKKLEKHKLSFPSLLTFSHQDLSKLAKQLGQQTVRTKEVEMLLNFNDKDVDNILRQVPPSIIDLKTRVHNIIANKSAKKGIDQFIELNPATISTDPFITQCIRLGKHALKNRDMLEALLKKFKNQAKVASILRVNRSSVSRRCKEFNLLEEQQEE